MSRRSFFLKICFHTLHCLTETKKLCAYVYVCNCTIIENINILRYEFDFGTEILSLNYFEFPACLPVRQINEMANLFLVKQGKKEEKVYYGKLNFSDIIINRFKLDLQAEHYLFTYLFKEAYYFHLVVAHLVSLTYILFYCTWDIIFILLLNKWRSPGFCSLHTSWNNSVRLLKVTSPSHSRTPLWGLGLGGWWQKGKEGWAPAQWAVLSREQARRPARTPGESAPSPLGHTARSCFSEKLSRMLASLFMFWYVNELGNLFPRCITILMFTVFILLPTYNRILVIKLSWTYTALKSVTGEK